MEISFDSPDLEALVQDLVNAESRIGPAVKAVVGKGALNIKKDAVSRFEAQRSGGYLPHYGRSISYDLSPDRSGASAEIGPDSSKLQGGMGAAIEYGTARTAPLPHLNPALDAELPKTEAALASAAVQVIT